ncbi:MAG: hypothetical protein GY830_01185 [Bacteroidetes bacterium]|nr:hypothetical protein [Bacteroidota bacterium]
MKTLNMWDWELNCFNNSLDSMKNLFTGNNIKAKIENIDDAFKYSFDKILYLFQYDLMYYIRICYFCERQTLYKNGKLQESEGYTMEDWINGEGKKLFDYLESISKDLVTIIKLSLGSKNNIKFDKHDRSFYLPYNYNSNIFPKFVYSKEYYCKHLEAFDEYILKILKYFESYKTFPAVLNFFVIPKNRITISRDTNPFDSEELSERSTEPNLNFKNKSIQEEFKFENAIGGDDASLNQISNILDSVTYYSSDEDYEIKDEKEFSNEFVKNKNNLKYIKKKKYLLFDFKNSYLKKDYDLWQDKFFIRETVKFIKNCKYPPCIYFLLLKSENKLYVIKQKRYIKYPNINSSTKQKQYLCKEIINYKNLDKDEINKIKQIANNIFLSLNDIKYLVKILKRPNNIKGGFWDPLVKLRFNDACYNESTQWQTNCIDDFVVGDIDSFEVGIINKIYVIDLALKILSKWLFTKRGGVFLHEDILNYILDQSLTNLKNSYGKKFKTKQDTTDKMLDPRIKNFLDFYSFLKKT